MKTRSEVVPKPPFDLPVRMPAELPSRSDELAAQRRELERQEEQRARDNAARLERERDIARAD